MPDIFAFMAQDPQTPPNGWKWGILLVIWPFYQISGQKCGRIFAKFQKIFHITTVSYAKSGAWYICIYGSRPSDPFKWVKMGVFTCNLWILPQFGSLARNLTIFPNPRSKMWADLWQFSGNFSYYYCFFSKIRRLTYLHLWSKTLRPL